MECPADIHLYAKQNFKYKKTTPFSPSCKFYNRMHNSGGVVFFCPRCMLLYSEAHGRRGWSGWRLLRRVAYATLCLRDTTMDQDVHECRKMGDTHSLCGSWPLRDDRSRDYRSGSCLLGKNHKPTKRDASSDSICHHENPSTQQLLRDERIQCTNHRDRAPSHLGKLACNPLGQWAVAHDRMNLVVKEDSCQHTADLGKQHRILVKRRQIHWWRGVSVTGEDRGPGYGQDACSVKQVHSIRIRGHGGLLPVSLSLVEVERTSPTITRIHKKVKYKKTTRMRWLFNQDFI